jgi:hypothetical protein
VSNVRTTNSKNETIVVYTTGTRYVWLTHWMPCLGIATADLVLNVRNVENNWQGKPCYQTAAVLPEYPDGPTVITAGAYTSTAGFTHYRETLGLTAKYWIRFGVAASNTSGVSIGSANVELQVALDAKGEQVAMGKVVVNPGMISGTDTNYFDIGPFTPTVGFDKVMAAFVVMNNDSTYLELQLVCRTAIDPRAPNAWQTCEAGWDNPAAGNSVRNTTALSAPGGANMSSNLLVQFGVAARKKSGAVGNPRAEISVAIARSTS